MNTILITGGVYAMKTGKKSFKLWVFLFVAVAFMIGAGGCGGGGYDSSEPEPVKFVGMPDKIDFLPDDWQQKVTDKIGKDGDTTKVVFLHNTSVADAVDAGVKDVYGAGAAVVLLEPTEESLNALAAATGYSPAVPVSKKGASQADANSESDPGYVLYAFISNSSGEHTYVFDRSRQGPDVPEPSPIREPIDDDPPVGEDEEGEDKEPATPSQVAPLDHFLEWLDNSGPKTMASRLARVKESTLADSTGDVLDLVKAQTVTFNNNMSAPWSLDGFQPTALYTDTYFIYAIYDADHKYDYYIFDQEEILTNGPMYQGLWTNSDWGSYTHYMGYYLYDYYTDHYLRDSGGNYLSNTQHNIIQPQPQVTTGSSSYTTSQSYTIGGSLGFAGMGGTGSISGSMTYSQSRTTSIPDVEVDLQVGQAVKDGAYNNARWTYKVGNLPQSVNNYTVWYPHDSTISPTPPAIAVNTATFYNNWIWRVSDPGANATYQVLCRSRPRYAYCECRASWPDFTYINNATLDDSTLTNGWTQERTINLIAPPRS
jgi:hypothetical protein